MHLHISMPSDAERVIRAALAFYGPLAANPRDTKCFTQKGECIHFISMGEGSLIEDGTTILVFPADQVKHTVAYTSRGKSQPVSIFPGMTVRQLKAQVDMSCGVEVPMQRILVDTLEVNDDDVLDPNDPKLSNGIFVCCCGGRHLDAGQASQPEQPK